MRWDWSPIFRAESLWFLRFEVGGQDPTLRYVYTNTAGGGLQGRGDGGGEIFFIQGQISQWPWSCLTFFSLQPSYFFLRSILQWVGLCLFRLPLSCDFWTPQSEGNNIHELILEWDPGRLGKCPSSRRWPLSLLSSTGGGLASLSSLLHWIPL